MGRKRSERPSWFKLFGHHESLMQIMPSGAVGDGVKAAMAYFNSGALPELEDPFAIALFAALKPQIEEAYADYRRSVETGRVGGLRAAQKNPLSTGPLYPPSAPLTEGEGEEEGEEEEEGDKISGSPFQKPTAEEVKGFCLSEGIRNVDARRFISYYDGNGWILGGSPITDWRAVVRSWSHSDRGKPQESGMDKLARLYGEEFTQ